MDNWYMPESIAPEGETSTRKSSSMVKEIIQLVLLVILVRLGMDAFLPRYVVEGASMEPNFHTNERVIVDRVSMLLSGPERGDVVVLNSPTTNELLIKRVIGLPNETIVIRQGRVYVNDRLLDEPYVLNYCSARSCDGVWHLGSDEYFVLGDNRSSSLDSHVFGPVHRSAIKGVARILYWPPKDIRLVSQPSY